MKLRFELWTSQIRSTPPKPSVTEQISQPFGRSQGSTPPTGLAVRFSCAGSVSHAVVNDAGGNGGQFWVCDVMWRVRRMPPVNQKQPASKSCDVVML